MANGMDGLKNAEELYLTGEYAASSPTWHIEDSPWKAVQVMRVYDPPAMDRPLRICEIGCGVGGVLASLDEILARRGIDARFTGFDIASVAVKRAGQIWRDRERLRFECQDVLTLERLDYDVCLLIDVLEHLDNPLHFLRELRVRGLSEYVVHLPLENNWLAIVRGKTDPRRSPVGHQHFYDTHSAVSLMEQADLNVTRRVYTVEIDHDIRLHRTFKTLLAYLPRKLMLSIWPALCVHTIGGAGLMLRCHADKFRGR